MKRGRKRNAPQAEAVAVDTAEAADAEAIAAAVEVADAVAIAEIAATGGTVGKSSSFPSFYLLLVASGRPPEAQVSRVTFRRSKPQDVPVTFTPHQTSSKFTAC